MPGPQETVRSFDPLFLFLIVLTVIFFVLTLYSIIQANLDVFNIKHIQFFSLEILSTESSASLFVTLLGALLVRNQFVLGLRPRISYKSNSNDSGKTWQVKIKNAGLGAAIINRCEFELETSSGKCCTLPLGFEEVIMQLAEIKLVCEIDFSLGNISKGFTFPPQEEYAAFEIKMEHIYQIKRLNMLLHFQGFLGDKYYRKVVLIPQGFTKAQTENL